MEDVNINRRVNHLVEISTQIAKGTPISHILNYKLSQEPTDKKHALIIKKILKDFIWNSQIIENIPTLPNSSLLTPVSITWKMPTAGTTCEYYYTNAGYIYSDTAIREHTSRMLQRITSQICAQNPDFGNMWGLSYLVSTAVGASVLEFNNNQMVEHNEETDDEEVENDDEI